MTSEQARHAADVLAELARQGISLSIQGEALRCRAPKGALTEALRAMLIEHKTELLTFLRAQGDGNASYTSIGRPKLERDIQQANLPAPLSFAQQRLWFLDQLQPGSVTYTIAVAVRFVGTLQASVLEQSLNEVVRRHESLRTTFAMVEGKAVQVIAPPYSLDSAPRVPLFIHTLEAVPVQEREQHIQQLARQEARQPFDLTQGSLLRATLLRLEEEDQVLLLTLHHIIADGWSLGILVRELALFYQAYTKGQLSSLPDLPIQYADYARWQRSWLQGEILQTQLAYWKEQLAGAPAVLELPLDYPRPAVQTFEGATHPVILSLSLTEALRERSQREGVTLFMTLLAAFTVLLSRYSRQEDMVVGTPVANRTHAETEDLIGFFVNMLVLRINLTGNPSFCDLLRRVRDVAQAAYAHQDVPFEQVVEALQPKRELSYTPLFQVTLVLQKAPLQSVDLGDVSLHPLSVESGTTQFDLSLRLQESPAGIEGAFEYNTDLFERATVTRMAAHWHTLLQGIIADPSRQLWDYPLLSEREQQQLLVEWNATQAAYPRDAVIHELFEAQVERSPHAIAVVCADQHLTYRDLNTRANQLAHYLHQQGVEPEVLVGLCLERCLDLMVGLLGILKAGGAYVPLDPAYPRERLAFLIEDTQAPLLLTQERLAAQFFDDDPAQFGKGKLICLDRLTAAISQQSTENVQRQVQVDHLAYVIYTSGSTGRPKGVLVNHRNLVHSTTARLSHYAEPVKGYLLLSSFAFDSSVAGIFWTLCQGGTLCLPQEGLQHDPQEMVNLIAKHQLSHLLCVPSFYPHLLSCAIPAQLASLQGVIVAGEPCPKTLVSAHQALLPRTALSNEYGPTEATVWSTVANCLSTASTHSVPIGRPIANTTIYILDREQQPVPIGAAGEIYIGGAGVARGYLRRPALTTERFVSDPFGDWQRGHGKPDARLYQTGDLARYRADGTIEFLGRLDQQVKIRGYRIELGEIEARLGQHPAIREAVVQACEDIPGDKRLVGYVVLDPEQPALGSSDLRRYLQSHLPDYMIPSDFVVLETLPLTSNGKIDRRALPTPDQSRPTLEDAYVAPRGSWECQMVDLWETILGKHPIGVRDDFFALGGHSLLAVALMVQVQTHFGRSLPLAALFQEATVEYLVHLLREAATEEAGVPGRTAMLAEAWSPLVPIQPHGTQRPFFCVHGADGTVLGYRKLAQYLGTEQPFYGLQARGVEDRKVPLTDIPTMTSSYLQAVRTLQPEGPYLLGGWSMGGLVAFEMAQQLVAQDQQVALVVLFDTWLDFEAGNTEATKPDHQLSLSDDATSSTELIRKLAQGDFSGTPLWQLGEEQLEAIRKAIHLAPESGLEQVHRLLRLYRVNQQASRIYVPHAYSGRVLLFTCEDQPAVAFDSSLSKWATVVPTGLVVQQTSGDHYSMLSEPHVLLVAEHLRPWLC